MGPLVGSDFARSIYGENAARNLAHPPSERILRLPLLVHDRIVFIFLARSREVFGQAETGLVPGAPGVAGG
jgi:hypothetical protein